MARGKGIVSLKDTVPDNEIIRNGEVRNLPNYIFLTESLVSQVNMQIIV
jgi:hypothetical protein